MTGLIWLGKIFSYSVVQIDFHYVGSIYACEQEPEGCVNLVCL